LVVSAVYACTVVYAWTRGWALPTTALIQTSEIARWAAENEHLFGVTLLCIGISGAIASRFAKSNETFPSRLFVWSVFPLMAAALVFSISSMWSGIVRPGDQNASSIAGLLQFSDSANYLSAAFDQATGGEWSRAASRRPMAAAFRSMLLWGSGYSVPLMLMLQAFMLAGAIAFATRAVVMWRGIWAGLAFLGLTYIYDRAYVQTVLTEPLGIFWALLSVPFYVDAIRNRSAASGLVALALTTISLVTRMGSLFTIPAVALWVVWSFGKDAREKVRLAILCAVVLVAVGGAQAFVLKKYGDARSGLGSNFSYAICGITLGTDWTGCPTKLASEGITLSPRDDEATRLLYSMALENFRAQPTVAIKRMALASTAFIRKVVDLLLRGPALPPLLPALKFALQFACLAGAFVMVRRGDPIANRLWALFWASLTASAALVYFDDGPRVLAASFPMLALFFSTGFGSPRFMQPSTLSAPIAGGAIVAALAVLVFGPGITSRAEKIYPPKAGEMIVAGGTRMSGFLVVENTDNLRKDIPTIRRGDLDLLLQHGGVDKYQGLFSPEIPKSPFGFVFAPRLEKGSDSSYMFIVPEEVISRHDVPAWRFSIARWNVNPKIDNDYWLFVTRAEPLP
jgi:hypothetical protein